VIQSFVDSWALFHNSYLAGWGIALLLAQIGVVVIARDQIFVGAALSQASTLGIAVALWVPAAAGGARAAWLESEVFAASLAVAFSVGAAFFIGMGSRGSLEARTGWVFLLGASFSILLLSHSPHGLEEIHRLVASSVVGATRVDVWVFGLLAAGTAAALALAARRILLVTTDPAVAEALGMRVWTWSLLLAAWLGVGVGLSIRASGALYTFGCLVLPALIAKRVCRELSAMLFVSPAIALAASMVGFALANEYDYPPAQLSVALLAVALGALWLLRSEVPRS
jgi:ABC-type Mn2+/Zn2+ transport system permease subunit